MRKADREAALQAALDAVSGSLPTLGYPWMDRRSTTNTRGVVRMTIRLEPVWKPVTESALVLALAKRKFRPRAVQPDPGIDLCVIHVPSGVEVDFAIAATLSKRTRTHLDRVLGRGWKARGLNALTTGGSTKRARST